MWLGRSKSANKIGLPRRRQQIIQEMQKMNQQHQRVLSKQDSRCSQRPTSTAFVSTRSSSYHLLLHSTPISPEQYRPNTTAQRQYPQRVMSPLSVIRTRSKCESSPSLSLNPEPKVFQSNFLKRGSAVDKAVIKQVLKSKLNMNVCAPSYSYCDNPSNNGTLSMVRGQIPRGVRDVVGVEEMMRMTHIMTGVNFKTVNLNKRLQETIGAGRRKCSTLQNEEEDAITLRSIKRW